jgi:carboxypeptidase Taq
MTAYAQLKAAFAKANTIGDALSVLSWDMATTMPTGGAERRAEQMALLKTMVHDILTAPQMGDLLAAAETEVGDPWDKANVREMRRDWVHATAVPADLVAALSTAASTCEMVWREARAKADFAMVLPHLSRLLGLVREQAAAKAQALGVDAYDALLDLYEPDGRSQEIDIVFADLESFLPGFLGRVLDAQGSRPRPALPAGPFPEETQKAVARDFMTAIGFDFTHGRLDTSHHPFCGGYPGDVRLTTRYDAADFTSAMMGVLHETGHAQYEAGLPAGAWYGQPVARARGMAIHESQSLLMEMQACRSRAFLNWAAPRLAQAFGGQGPLWDADNLYRLGIWVEPGFIRVDADELTYPAHVILRYEIERALIEGEIEAEDIPALWDEKMMAYLGIDTRGNYADGCLQDVHWTDGSFGYFPSYTLGAMYAAQYFACIRQAVPDLDRRIAAADLAPVSEWLNTHIWSLASLHETDELVRRATGEALNPLHFRRHLEARYL